MTCTWSPPDRPEWVRRFNDHATHVGDASMVSLDPEELLADACDATGLSDFDEQDGWREHYGVFLDAVARESPLHLLGRIMTRTDVLRSLENRLQLVDLWRQRPEILEIPVPEPLFIVGAARSGTSILHEVLALDPSHAVPTTWKIHRPVTAAVGDADEIADARRSVDSVVRFWHDVQPEYEAMHHNHGDLPTECIFATMPMFLSDNWSGSHTAPTYDLHLATADHRAAYEWHRRTLQTLSLREPATRWVLKAPSHLATLRQLFAVYPDARVLHIHRDPARTLPSMFDLMGTLKWMRNERVDLSPTIGPATAGTAHLQRRAIADRADGTLPDDRFHDLHYASLMADPVEAIRSAYDGFGWRLGDDHATAIASYLAAKPQGAKGSHAYSLAEFGLTADGVRHIFADYLDRFSIPPEN